MDSSCRHYILVQRRLKIELKVGKKVMCTPCTGTEALYRPYGPEGE